MKKTYYLLLTIFVLAFAAYGQKIAKPTLTSKAATADQSLLIQLGITLHDAGKYDQATAKYEEVLAQNPDCTQAIYELSMTLYAKGDKEKSMETANRGSKYISDELPLFYVTMANILDDYGKHPEAIKIYQDGIKLLEGDKRFASYRASLNYNLGVTYTIQKQYDDARKALKSAVEDDFNYGSPHFLLSYVYNGTKYKVPAFLAASRFISLEYNTARSKSAAAIISGVMKPAAADPKTGNINIFLNMDAPKDEGDYGVYDLILGTLLTVKSDKDKNKAEEEVFVEALDSLIALISEDKKLKSTFVGKNYVPFIVDLKKNGYVRPFGYMILYNSGNNLALEWLQINDTKLKDFVQWAKAYQAPVK